MIFGVFAPQGWKMELAGIEDPQDKWATTVRTARLAEELGLDSVWVYDHFHNVPVPAHEAVFECWTTMAALAASTSTHPPRPDGQLRRLPQPGPGRQDHLDHRRHLRRPPRLGHRRRVVRPGVPGLRLRLPVRRRPHPHAARDRRDREAHVDRARRHLRGPPLQRGRCPVRPQAAAGPAPAGLDRRRRRAAHPAGGGPPRRPLQLRRQARRVRAQVRGPPGALPAVGRDYDEITKTWSPEVFIRDDEAEIVAGGTRSFWGEPFESWRDGNLVGTPEQVCEKLPSTATWAAGASCRGARTTPRTRPCGCWPPRSCPSSGSWQRPGGPARARAGYS